jgi:hypothetical protein
MCSSMLGFLKELKSWVLVSRRSQDHASVDTVVSALHHRVTSAILLVCCALISSRQYFGEPILCIQDGPDDDTAIPSNVLNTYCFISSTYTVVGPAGKGSYCILLIKCCKIFKLPYPGKHPLLCLCFYYSIAISI